MTSRYAPRQAIKTQRPLAVAYVAPGIFLAAYIDSLAPREAPHAFSNARSEAGMEAARDLAALMDRLEDAERVAKRVATPRTLLPRAPRPYAFDTGTRPDHPTARDNSHNIQCGLHRLTRAAADIATKTQGGENATYVAPAPPGEGRAEARWAIPMTRLNQGAARAYADPAWAVPNIQCYVMHTDVARAGAPNFVHHTHRVCSTGTLSADAIFRSGVVPLV
jgi:hypothetical protein